MSIQTDENLHSTKGQDELHIYFLSQPPPPLPLPAPSFPEDSIMEWRIPPETITTRVWILETENSSPLNLVEIFH